MTESAMEAMAVQEDSDLAQESDDPRDKIEFEARLVPWSGVVGNSVILAQPGGPVIGQLALLCFGERADQEYWANRITRALNNGAKAEKAIAHFIKRGMIKTAGEMPAGKGGPPRTTRAPVDIREFVKGLDKPNAGGNHGAAIRGDQGTAHRKTDG